MIKKIILCCVIIFANIICVPSAAPAADNVRVPIILYHNIKPNIAPEENYLLNITPENFRMHMETLKKNNFSPINFYDYYNYIQNNIALPKNPIIISFDDGYTSNYEYAYPILKELNMHATIFVVTERVGAGVGEGVIYPHFSWEQAREMQSSSFIDIESHSDSHGNMFEMPKGDMQRELRRSKYMIEKNLNKNCDVFAFPYGGNTIESRILGAAAEYKILCLVGDVGANSAGDDISALKRITIDGRLTETDFIDTIKNNLF